MKCETMIILSSKAKKTKLRQGIKNKGAVLVVLTLEITQMYIYLCCFYTVKLQ